MLNQTISKLAHSHVFPRLSANLSKPAAWDIIGCVFWTMAHEYLTTGSNLMNKLLSSVHEGQRCCVLGASTVEFIRALINHKSLVSVIDFSKTMCDDLIRELGRASYEIVLRDILDDVPQSLISQFDFIFSDQLVNCLVKSDVTTFFRHVASMLVPGGEYCCLVRLGLYPFDELLIAEGRRKGTLQRFWDDTTRTIDFAEAKNEIEELLKNGSKENERLIAWYIGRGKETRFNETDFDMLLPNTAANEVKLVIIDKSRYDGDRDILCLRTKAVVQTSISENQ